jgi:hypothetical protein
MYEKEKNGRGGTPDTLWCGRNSKRIKYVTGISSEWAGGVGDRELTTRKIFGEEVFIHFGFMLFISRKLNRKFSNSLRQKIKMSKNASLLNAHTLLYNAVPVICVQIPR